MQDKDSIINQAVKILNCGGIIIFPTDTAYGIGCKVSEEKAVSRLFDLRRREKTKAVPVLIDSLKMAKKYIINIPSEVTEKLIKPYWPGALTIILRSRSKNIPGLIRGGKDTIGLRIPNNDTIREIIKGVGEGIVGCSANFGGEKTPFRFEDLDPELVKLVDFVVPSEINSHQTSTVIDCSVRPWRILREGAIKIFFD